MTVYDITPFDNVTDLGTFVTTTNVVADYWYAYVTLLLLWVIVVLVFKSYDTKVVMFVASFISSIVSVLFYLMGFFTIEMIVISVVAMVASLIAMMWRGDK